MTTDVDAALAEVAGPNGWSMILDQSRGCAWSYLRDPSGRLVSDVWLYNLQGIEPPADSIEAFVTRGFEGQPQNPPPFASIEDGVDAGAFHALEVRWSPSGHSATIHLLGAEIAKIHSDERPGHSRYARKDGPLARMLPAE